ncbi:MAG TPA: DUF6263 family protein, partial [Lacipirellulaceae bacterium]|nr:DUF6263 family protein [Lacipirellulaceae bacterium]
HQEMDMIWDVQGVDAATGEAVIDQKFDRIKLTVTSPRGNVDYDSKEDKVSTGLEALIAPLYKAIAQSEFELTVTSRGEIKDAKVPAEVLAALKNVPDAAAIGDYATEEGFKKMISKSVFVLPKDAPKKGDVTKTSVELTNKDGEKQIVESSYTYEGTKDIDGETYAIFKPQLTLSFADGGQAAKSSVAQQSSDGEALFNIAKGRLRSMKLEQHVTINSSSANQPVQQKLDQKIEVEVSKRDEKASAGETTPADAGGQTSKK